MANYRVEGDRLFTAGGAVPYVDARAYDRKARITPTVIVLHDTAGWITKGNAVRWFSKDPKCTTSAHLVQERDGTFVQLVEFDRRAYHAGKSVFKKRKDVNFFGIGIEIANPGVLTKAGKAWFHKKASDYFSPDAIVQKTTKAHGPGYWLPYTEEQVEEIIGACRALVKAYPTIKDITTHWEISPGRKVDCNPLFPLERVRAEVFGKAEAPIAAVPVADASLKLGSTGAAVVKLQDRLKALGYAGVGVSDGMFGSRTRAAVLAFEAENGLPSDGVLTEYDSEKLYAAEAKGMPVSSLASASAADLALSGSRIAGATQFGKKLIWRVASFLGLTTTADALLSGGEGATAVLDGADKLRTTATRSTDLLGFLQSDLGLALFVLAIAAAAVWFLLDYIERARVNDAKTGKTAPA